MLFREKVYSDQVSIHLALTPRQAGREVIADAPAMGDTEALWSLGHAGKISPASTTLLYEFYERWWARRDSNLMTSDGVINDALHS